MNLARRGILINDILCPHGCESMEDERHLFFTCQYARGLWFTAPWGIKWRDQVNLELEDYLRLIWCPKPFPALSKQDQEHVVLYCAFVLEHLWWVRNEVCFKEILYHLMLQLIW